MKSIFNVCGLERINSSISVVPSLPLKVQAPFDILPVQHPQCQFAYVVPQQIHVLWIAVDRFHSVEDSFLLVGVKLD